MQYEPKGLADVLSILLGLGVEYGNEGIRLSDKGMKRRAVLEALLSDSRKHEGTLPSDLLKVFGILFLFALDESSFISFPYESTSKWEEFKEAFYRFTEMFDDVFTFKKKKGAPTSQYATTVGILVAVSRELNRAGYAGYNEKAGQYWNYLGLLFTALKARLEKSEEYKKRKTDFERAKVRERELKAVKTAVDRSWKSIYQDQPPKLEKLDKELIKGWVIGDFTQTQQFIERFKAKFSF